MMPDRKMFWRILRRIFTSNRGRLFVILLALGAGAAVTAALLNLQIDAKRRITSEFRAFGPNVLIVPKGVSASSSETLPESIIHSVPVNLPSGRVAVSAALYLVASVSVAPSGKSRSVVVAGTNPLALMTVSVRSRSTPPASPNELTASLGHMCVVGARVAQQIGVQQDAELVLANGDHRCSRRVASFRASCRPEDDRVEIPLRMAQRLAELPNRISTIEITVTGTPSAI